ncbi:uncharacterized protein LOC136087713 [Hydra vulgaris]|uniref:Uncharacterized protein LOC136087713 n=1 Tax=Hydra vulgaris TaxID=6087 RepID=A0ABM4CZ14_HYDVU
MSDSKASKLFYMFESAIRQEFDSKVSEANIKWKEIQSTVQNLKADASENFKIKEHSGKTDEIHYWKDRYQKESMKREKLQLELNKVSNEIEKLKRKIESTILSNANLKKRLESETEMKLHLVDEIMEENSQFNKMSAENKIAWLNKIKKSSKIE